MKMTTSPLHRAVVALTAVLAASLAAGCDGETTHEHGTPLDEACEHMAEGPFANVQATADRAAAPAADMSHTSMTILLPQSGAMREGYVRFPSAEVAEMMFFLGADVPFTLSDASEAAVAIEASDRAITACSEVAVSHTADLEVGTYWLHFGPTTQESVSLVFEEAGGEHVHE